MNNNWITVILSDKIREILYNQLSRIKEMFPKKSHLIDEKIKKKYYYF